MTTDQFYSITPDVVLDAVEGAGLIPTGRIFQLNSYENRVYELELDPESTQPILNMPDPTMLAIAPSKVVVKFYRPGRWNKDQLHEEHSFLRELLEAEVPAVPAAAFPDGSTLQTDRASGIHFALYPKVGGRSPQEFDDEQCLLIGRLMARMHNVGAAKPFEHRIRFDSDTMVRKPLAALEEKFLMPEFKTRYRAAADAIAKSADKMLSELKYIRTHGDCHLGNLLWNGTRAFFLDFDDMGMAPAIQDFWMLIPGRDAEARERLELMLEGYEQFRTFDRREIQWIETLRAMRIIHYSGWLARRWEDPIFPRSFPHFATADYWERELRILEERATSQT